MKEEINCEKIVNGELKELPDIHKEYLWTMLLDYKNPHEAKQFELRSERLEKMGYDVKRFIHVYKKSIIRLSDDSDRDDIRMYRTDI